MRVEALATTLEACRIVSFQKGGFLAMSFAQTAWQATKAIRGLLNLRTALSGQRTNACHI